MKHYDYLIIGGGIAGVTAAEAIRGEDPAGTIGVLSDEPHLLYSRVLLPSYLKKRIRREQVFLRDAGDFSGGRIDLHLQRPASAVDTASHQVHTADGEVFGYEKLLISSGGKVNQWRGGWSDGRVHRLQTLDDADRLYRALGKIREPLVVGSSFIALEYIEIFLSAGVLPRVFTKDEYFFGRMLDSTGGALMAEHFASHGVPLSFDDEITSVEEGREALEVSFRRAGALHTDVLAVGIGITRNIGFLAGSGITLGEGVRTDEYLETNVPGVFAAGDIAEYHDLIAGRPRLVGNWTNAVLQGKRAGLNMAGQRAPFRNVPSYAITNLGFQITAVGECDNALEAVSRSGPERHQYERFFLRQGSLAGAFLINHFADKPHISELISRRVNIERFIPRLRDTGFDIRAIPAVH